MSRDAAARRIAPPNQPTEESSMKFNAMVKSLLLATSVCALAISMTARAHAYSQFTGINNGLAFQFWDTNDNNNSGGPSFAQNGSGNYWVSWSNYNGDFTTGTGWWQGVNGDNGYVSNVGYNAGAYSQQGGGCFGIYGWFLGVNYGYPDTEYYIIEMSAGAGPGGTHYGSFSSDGATYDVYHNYNPNGRGLNGNNPNGQEQWISVRRGNNSTGQNHNVNVAAHFNTWKSLGWRMGAFSSEELVTEGWGGPSFGGGYSAGYVNATVWHD
jgi:endo-1,4-beta-xylanase